MPNLTQVVEPAPQAISAPPADVDEAPVALAAPAEAPKDVPMSETEGIEEAGKSEDVAERAGKFK